MTLVPHQYKQPLLTIVVCTFNAEKYLLGCLSSIVVQKTAEIRLYVMDGGSSDSTLGVIKNFENYIDFLCSKKDEGVYDAMNKAVANIKSGWILFLGADDRIMPNSLLRLCDTLRQPSQTSTMFYGDVYRPSLNKLYDEKFSVYKLMRRNICQQSILYPCEAFKKYSFDINFRINADHILNIQLFFDRNITKRYIPICISYYEDISDGISRNTSDAGLLRARRELALTMGGIFPYLFAICIDLKEWLRRRIYYLLP